MSGLVLVMGEVNPDIVVTGVPALSFAQREDLTGPTSMTVGSSVAITACGLARLGTPVGLVGVVGDDAFGDFMLRELTRRGVGVDLVRTVPGGRTGSSVILVRADDPSDRQILTDPAVMGDLRAGDLPPSQRDALRHLHIGSWFLHAGAVTDLPALLADVRAGGATTSVDPNDDPLREWDSHLPEALAHVDTFFCNESEARGVARAGAAVSRDDVAELLLARLAPGGTLVLKCGAEGACAYSSGGTVRVAAPRVDVVDTVGAGDSLAAGYLHARLGGAAVADALGLGVACGTLSTRRSGGVDGQATGGEAGELAGRLVLS